MLIIIAALIFVFVLLNNAKNNKVQKVASITDELKSNVETLEEQIKDLGLPIAEQEKVNQFDFTQTNNEINVNGSQLNNLVGNSNNNNPYTTNYKTSSTQQIINAIGGGGRGVATELQIERTEDFFQN